jgi:hypothetical protein
MRNLFKKQEPPAPKQPISIVMRDTVWGDAPMDQWPPQTANAEAEPWNRFAKARTLVSQNKNDEAIQVLRDITELPDLESRHYLQAWKFLRQLKYPVPQDKHNLVYGLIFEVAMPKGLDLLAAYQDCHARFYSYAGSGTVWERPDDRLDKAIQALLTVGQAIAGAIGTAEKPRPEVPPLGQMRFSMLTPGGLAFGQGPEQALMQDKNARIMVMAAANLLKEITTITVNAKKS